MRIQDSENIFPFLTYIWVPRFPKKDKVTLQIVARTLATPAVLALAHSFLNRQSDYHWTGYRVAFVYY